jgi:hypothetical protein
MAEGGDVQFCAQDRKHKPDCEYFQGGGLSGQEVPDDETPAASLSGQEVPDEQSLSGQEVPADVPAAVNPLSGQEVPDSAAPGADSALLAGVESFVRGALPGGVGPWLEKNMVPLGDNPEIQPVISPEAQAARAEGQPVASAIGSLAGTIASPLNLVGAGAASLTKLGKVGSAAVSNGIANGLITGGDELSDYLLTGKEPAHPVASIIISTGIGGFLGRMGAKSAIKGAELLDQPNIDKKVMNTLAGIGSHLNEGNPQAQTDIMNALKAENFDKKAFESGKDFAQSVLDKSADAVNINARIISGGGVLGGAWRGFKKAGPLGAGIGALKGYAANKAATLAGNILGNNVKKYGAKAYTPVVMKILESGDTRGMFDVLNHADKIAAGLKATNNMVENVFTGAARTAASAAADPSVQKGVENYFDMGGPDGEVQQLADDQNEDNGHNYAEGGEVKPPTLEPSGMAIHYPAQEMMLQDAKVRASKYLMGLRPQKIQPKLAFDANPDDKAQHKTYQQAMGVAHNPLGILDEIKKGTIEPSHLQHLNAMFPEVTDFLQKKLTDRITQGQLNGDKPPPWQIRQGLSMFMGTPLSGEFTPAGIQAAQSVYAQKAAAQQPMPGQATRKKKSTAPLTNSDKAYLTNTQASQQRSQSS